MLKRTKTIGMRVNEDETHRLELVLERVRARTSPYIDMSKLVRELAGLVDTGLVTEEDRAIIRGQLADPVPIPQRGRRSEKA